MKTTLKYILVLISIVAFYSCGDMDEMNTNNDSATKVPADFLSTKLSLNMTSFSGGKWLFGEAWIVKTMSFTEHNEDYLYNKFLYHGFDSYHDLIDASEMMKAAENDEVMKEGIKNSYQGLYHFVRAFTFYNTTMRLGDVPCSEAGRALEGNVKPVYDPQEKVMATIIRELEEASKFFAKGANFTGDIVYGGNASKWHKLANSFLLRVLINLSKKETVDGINVKQKFAEYSKMPLISSESDNFQRVYSDRDKHRYPYNVLQQNYRVEGVLGKFLVDKLKELKDYRLFYYGEPAPISTEPSNSFDAYSGVDVNTNFSIVQDENSRGLHTRTNNRYLYDPVGEPTAEMSSSEVQFILAEAAVRGWETPLSAEEHYKKGVNEAMSFTAKYTLEKYRHGVVIDQAYIDTYLNAEGKYNNGTTKQQIEQIIWQKFIASFIQLKFNPYYDYRRTGYPKIPINPSTNLNRDPSKMPMRWMYDLEESEKNSVHLMDALRSQFGGEDYPTGIMWILK